jgi:hypothetical protein
MLPKNENRKFVVLFRALDGRVCASFMQHDPETGESIVVEAADICKVYESIRHYQQ